MTLRSGEFADEVSNLNLTRQLIPEGGEDDDVWQLALNFEFEPTSQLRALGNGDRWCHSLQELPQFRDYALASAPYTVCGQFQIRRTTLRYECVG